MKVSNFILVIIIVFLSIIILFLSYFNIKSNYERIQLSLINNSILDKNIALSKYIYLQDYIRAQYDPDFFVLYDENQILTKANQSKLNYLTRLNTWIYENIEYKPDGINNNEDNWQLSDETKKLKTGDCEDFSLLFFDEAKKKYNIDVTMVWVISSDNIISHMVIEWNDYIFDSTTNKVFWKDKFYMNFFVVSRYDKEKIDKVISKHKNKK